MGKHRITYINRAGHDFSVDNIRSTSDAGLRVGPVKGAKEHRVTVGLAELPVELCWIRVTNYISDGKQPKPHGLWVHIHPRLLPDYTSSLRLEKDTGGYSHGFRETGKLWTDMLHSEHLCPILRSIFSEDIKCSTYEKTFTHPPVLSARFATSASSQYYTALPSLSSFVKYVQGAVCTSAKDGCTEQIAALSAASRLDAEYDAISQALTISAYWDEPTAGSDWNEDIRKFGTRDEKIEIGVFNQEPAPSEEDIKLGGWVAIVGESKSASTTLFSFPSRHHSLKDSSVTTTLDLPIGLHPTLRLKIISPSPASNPTCSLHAYLILPSAIFIDRYAFSDSLMLKSHNLAALRAISGATDLEAPDWAVDAWGSAVLFELSPPDSESSETSALFDVTIPLHLRYLSPMFGGYVNVTMPQPNIFWACRAQDDEAPPLSTNPFDRRNLGYDGLFSDQTIFYHVPEMNARNEGIAPIVYPVLDMDRARYVQSSTVLVITLGTFWLLWKLLGPIAAKKPSSRHDGVSQNRSKDD